MILEACVSSYESAKYASHKKLDRVELCAGLEIGGLTPSLAMQKKVAKLKNINLHVLIRPRGGDFVYSSEELKIIKKDIHYASKHGANGVVFGCLNKNFGLAEENWALVQYAKSLNLKVTFHRAFDLIPNHMAAIESLCAMGVDTVLTSGGALTAMEGIDQIQKMQSLYGNAIEIMPGGGVKPENLHFFKSLKIPAVHFSIEKFTRTESAIFGQNHSLDKDKVESILDYFR